MEAGPARGKKKPRRDSEQGSDDAAVPRKRARKERRAASGGREAGGGRAARAAGQTDELAALEERLDARLAQIEAAVSAQSRHSEQLLEKIDEMVALAREPSS
jgi:hypothetical protein